MKIIYYSLTALAILGSCSKAVDPNDKTKPVLEITSTNPVFKLEGDEKIIEAAKGSSFTVNVKITDNSGLKQLKFDIHENFDGHSHARKEGTNWATSKIVTHTGKEATHSETFTIPSDATLGEYHCEMIVLDQNGNESIEYILAVEVK